jgi:hypothetical protein
MPFLHIKAKFVTGMSIFVLHYLQLLSYISNFGILYSDHVMFRLPT